MAQYGTITLDGSVADWGAPVYDDGAGHKVFARYQDGMFIFAATGATPGTTFWLNTDRNGATGYQGGGPGSWPFEAAFAAGAEFKIEIAYANLNPLAYGLVLANPETGSFYPFSVPQAWSGSTVEFAIPATELGLAGSALDLKVDFGNSTFLLPVFTVAPPADFGTVALDGALGDWNPAAEVPVNASYSPPGSRFFATAADGAFVFALETTDLATAGARILIDSDRNDATGSTFNGVYNESLVKFPPGGAYYPIANGVDFDIRFDASGHPQLYKGDGTLVGPLACAVNGDTIELAVPQSVLGGAQPAEVTLEFFNGLYGVGYVPPTVTVGGAATVAGGVQLDGGLSDWAPAQQIDSWQTGLVGYEIRGKATADGFVIAMKAPTAIGANTTAWINTDADSSTGHRIWGFAGGAEYYVNFDAAGRPQLFAADGTLVAADLAYAYSPDHTAVELVVPKALVGGVGEINTLYDFNDSVFLPTRYLATQYRISDGAAAPVIGSNGGGDAAGLTVAENSTAVTTVSATGVTHYAILAGVDALAFEIDPTSGALLFAAAPDFEAPTDEDGNNVYEVTVAAVDALGHSDVQQLQVAVADVAALTLTGDKRANVLTGDAEGDTLSGAGGNDTLRGMGGADVLRGGAGFDTLAGGAGPDRFVFATADEIGNGKTPMGRDVITDFAVGEDKVDLSAIDANEGARGNQAFAFVGTAAFTGAGQLHLVRTLVAGVEHTVVEGNLNNGAAPEFRLDLVGHLELTAGDFAL